MKKKVLIWFFALIAGFLAGISVEYFIWDTPVKESIIPLLCADVILFIVLFLFDRRELKKKAQS
ncbi:MAG: hypothetical protein K2I87_01075 [Bacteroidales bacterium]|nr:hypothetical protein [Bacteroidales bacterium]